MVGSNGVLIQQLINSDQHPINKKFKRGANPDEVLEFMVKEYWKEWKKKLMNSTQPYIKCPGLGVFELNYSKAKYRLRALIRKLKRFKKNNPEKYLNKECFLGAMYEKAIQEFRILWKQVDVMKIVFIKDTIRRNKAAIRLGKPEYIRVHYEWIFETSKGLVDTSNERNSSCR